MELAAMLQLISFVIAEAPQAISLVEQIIANIKKNYTTPEERLAALQSVMAMLTPMEKEI